MYTPSKYPQSPIQSGVHLKKARIEQLSLGLETDLCDQCKKNPRQYGATWCDECLWNLIKNDQEKHWSTSSLL